jgi:hypothetical protein
MKVRSISNQILKTKPMIIIKSKISVIEKPSYFLSTNIRLESALNVKIRAKHLAKIFDS